MTVTTSAEPLYSTLADDSDLGELIEVFVSELPERVALLELAWNDGNYDLLRRTAHQLKGALGSYGYGKLTPFAARLENAVRSSSPEVEVGQRVEELVQHCLRCRAGKPPSLHTALSQ